MDNKDYNGDENIIMYISKTSFLQLKHLYLSRIMIKRAENQISSMEQLQFVNMPVLEWLNLCKNFDKSGKNKITKVSALNKCSWSSLTYLDLGKFWLTVRSKPNFINWFSKAQNSDISGIRNSWRLSVLLVNWLSKSKNGLKTIFYSNKTCKIKRYHLANEINQVPGKKVNSI